MDVIKIALIQMKVLEKKKDNLIKAEEKIIKASNDGAKLIILPEMFNCPYKESYFPEYAEQEGGYTWQLLSEIAKEKKVYLVGGSIPEVDEMGKVYNTSYVFNYKGNQIAKHRKVHLFDIDIKGGQSFKESDTLSAGNTATVFDAFFEKMGVVICYDFRFPELSRLTVEMGAKLIIVPGAFNMTTGPAHWEILFRTRAVDNQVYTIGVAPARNYSSNYISYGNSIIVDPWGNIINRLGEGEGILIEDLYLSKVESVRRELPLLKHLRKDIY
jgi:omega-amidase